MTPKFYTIIDDQQRHDQDDNAPRRRSRRRRRRRLIGMRDQTQKAACRHCRSSNTFVAVAVMVVVVAAVAVVDIVPLRLTTVSCFQIHSIPTTTTTTTSNNRRSSTWLSMQKQTNLFYANNSTMTMMETSTSTTTTATTPSSPSPPVPPIYVDMDGVLVDFEKGVRDALRTSTTQFEGFSGVDNRRKQLWKQLQLKGTIHWFRTLDWMKDGKLLWEYIKPLKPTILSGVPYMLVPYACHDKFEWCSTQLGIEPDRLIHIDMAALNCPTNNGHVRVNGGNGSPDIEDDDTDEKCNHDVTSTATPTTSTTTRVITCWSHNKHLECTTPGSILIDDRIDLRCAWENAGGIFIHHTSAESTVQQLQQLGVLPTSSSSSTSSSTTPGDGKCNANDYTSIDQNDGGGIIDDDENNEQQQYYWDGSSCTSTRKWGWW